MITKLLLITASLMAMPASSAELPRAVDAKVLAPFFAKNPKNCVLAVGVKNDIPDAVAPVYCVWDGVAFEGTVNEAKGCMIGTFEPATGDWFTFIPHGRAMVPESKGKDCSKEVIAAMLKYGPSDFGFSSSAGKTFSELFRKNTVVLFDKFGVQK